MNQEKIIAIGRVIGELRHRNFMDWSTRAHFMVILLASIVLLILINSIIFPATSRQITKNVRTMTELQQQYDHQQQLIVRMGQQKTHPVSDTTLLQRIHPLDLPELISQLSAVAIQNHVQINALKPLMLQQTQDFNVQPLQLTLSGHYASLLNFIQCLTQLPTLLLLGDFRFSDSAEIADQQKYPLQLIISLYAYAPSNT